MLASTGTSTAAGSPLMGTRNCTMVRSACSWLCERTAPAWTADPSAQTAAAMRTAARISDHAAPLTNSSGALQCSPWQGDHDAECAGNGFSRSDIQGDVAERVPG